MRKTMCFAAIAIALGMGLATEASAQTMGRPVSRHAGSMSIFARGGGEQPRVAAVTTGLRHERVSHRRSGTAGFHYRSTHGHKAPAR